MCLPKIRMDISHVITYNHVIISICHTVFIVGHLQISHQISKIRGTKQRAPNYNIHLGDESLLDNSFSNLPSNGVTCQLTLP